MDVFTQATRVEIGVTGMESVLLAPMSLPLGAASSSSI